MTRHTRIRTGWYDPDEPLANTQIVDMPSGYYRVWSGAAKPFDLYAQQTADGEIVWCIVGDALDYDPLLNMAASFLALIRIGWPVENPCMRCCSAAREDGYYCCLRCSRVLEEKNNR